MSYLQISWAKGEALFGPGSVDLVLKFPRGCRRYLLMYTRYNIMHDLDIDVVVELGLRCN